MCFSHVPKLLLFLHLVLFLLSTHTNVKITSFVCRQLTTQFYPDFLAHLKSLNMKPYKTADSFKRASLNASWQTFQRTSSVYKLLTALSSHFLGSVLEENIFWISPLLLQAILMNRSWKSCLQIHVGDNWNAPYSFSLSFHDRKMCDMKTPTMA